MNVTTSIHDKTAVIHLQGRFDFTAHRSFRDEFKLALANDSVREIQVDMSGVAYVDSSALGMLLMSRENCLSAGKTISLTHATGAVRQVLEIASFHRLFTIT